MKVERSSEAELTVERSRFYALLAPAESEGDVKKLLAKRRKAIRKACHHCWACRIATEGGQLVEQARDDGEVGRPGYRLLEILRRHELEGVLVVSRIFGGVKLGPGGVGRAFAKVGEAVVGVATSPAG